jgi:hypothetical protein
MALREDQIRRYARHVLLPDFGGVGQERLLASTVTLDPRDPAAVVAFEYLVAAGVGTIALAVAAPALVARAAALNPDVEVVVGARGTPLEVAPSSEGDGALIGGGAAACALLHRLATHSPP